MKKKTFNNECLNLINEAKLKKNDGPTKIALEILEASIKREWNEKDFDSAINKLHEAILFKEALNVAAKMFKEMKEDGRDHGSKTRK